jgi:hypothetical protein
MVAVESSSHMSAGYDNNDPEAIAVPPDIDDSLEACEVNDDRPTTNNNRKGCLEVLLELKGFKLTEIQQAIELAKAFSPMADEGDAYWKKVFELQQQSKVLDDKIERHRRSCARDLC